MFKSGVTLITATGNRPKCLQLCQSFIARQTWKGPIQWIVVDDGDDPLEIKFPGVLLTHIFPEPEWKPGQNTLARNLLAAIPEVFYDNVLFIEDDDWQSPN